jgi:hypothetical protein
MPCFDLQNKAIVWKQIFVVLAKMVWEREFVTHVGRMKTAYNIPVRKPEEKADYGVCEQAILKFLLKK